MPARAAAAPTAEILATGDELVRGRSRDTNSAAIAEALTAAGFRVRGFRTVGDDRAALVDALRAAAARARVVVVTGGLGPTADDLTREAAAALLRAPLVEHAPSLRRIRGIWRRRGVPMPPGNRRQALVPRGASVIPNPAGSAPGLRFRTGRAEVFCLPGVPREMLAMLEASVLPAARAHARGGGAASAWVTCFGVAESEAGERLADLMGRGRAVRVGTSVADGVLRIGIHGAGAAAGAVAGVRDAVVRRLGPWVVAADGVDLAEALVRDLRARRLTVALAESCTAGLAAARIADVAGASGVLLGGVVAYANGAKRALLGVPAPTLARHGAVSAPTALAMARGARRRFGADLAVAVTGVAGPGGGTPEKPVGLVWLAVASARGERAEERRWTGPRAFVRSIAANAALDLLRREAAADARERG